MLQDKIILIALNKPKGFICTHRDEYNRRKAIDLIPKKTLKTINGKIHSVGRLDYNSQGLLLLTNNTKIKNYLESPSNKIIRIYKVKVQQIVDIKTIKKIQKGLIINNMSYKVKAIKVISTTKSYSWVLIKLEEGKNNHIRKVFHKLGFTVNKLIRIQYGPVKLSSLKSGSMKFISPFKLNLINL
ncbi:MAG: hypothetical protein CMJ06_01410 [Pelagibacterales bacterium]|nr:hypothetical protein [Pelagibacterales bacterium]OUU63322.1 MAG: hypothetical protein CBC22_01380 [Alphaproteobacteria bacterium TMED62]|tara:strand:+ start:7643 stop:8197 length:555 start_codon:yes stop_codon:yes gene_type:complete